MTPLGWLTLGVALVVAVSLLAMLSVVTRSFPLDPEQRKAPQVQPTKPPAIGTTQGRIERMLVAIRTRRYWWSRDAGALVTILEASPTYGLPDARARFGAPRSYRQGWIDEQLRNKEHELNTRVVAGVGPNTRTKRRRWRATREQ